ncbi:RNA polymerase sigma-H factor [Dyadobacter sp. CECT 9275]|uniref:RNA polymerase sigma-H factor n=1 Tax=Dyadobacter helix TaxID=2822344 RepID=A0A916JIW3_9BACT|nr:RNA polymerase sigma factor [Dyadobacter sp. CECT 9275]CAG5008327.1 RNA polymerase sigma-H factor [Dyadobacter sp. CECT 9275]
MSLFQKQKFTSLTTLVKGCQRGEPKAQNAFYDHYKRKLRGICLRYTRTESEADDIFQEAFIKIFNSIHQLRAPEAADPWVKSTVIRTAINYYKSHTKKDLRLTSVDEMEPVLASEESLEQLDRVEMGELLAVINELPDGYRTVINLYIIDGFKHAEIADMLGVAESTSKSQLMRGKALLIKKLHEKGIGQYGFVSKGN